MPSSISVQITIGRNVGTVPMSDDQWGSFRADAETVMYLHTVPIDGPQFTPVEFRASVSHFGGMAEESSIFIVFDSVALPSLSARLSRLARTYGQESIAMTRGAVVEFVTASN